MDVPSLKQILGHICCPQSEHMLSFAVVFGWSGDGVMDHDCIVECLEAALLETVLVLVQIQHHPFQCAEKHLPSAPTQWR